MPLYCLNNNYLDREILRVTSMMEAPHLRVMHERLEARVEQAGRAYQLVLLAMRQLDADLSSEAWATLERASRVLDWSERTPLDEDMG